MKKYTLAEFGDTLIERYLYGESTMPDTEVFNGLSDLVKDRLSFVDDFDSSGLTEKSLNAATLDKDNNMFLYDAHVLAAAIALICRGTMKKEDIVK